MKAGGTASRAFSVFNLLALSAFGGLVFRPALAFLVLAVLAAVMGSGGVSQPATLLLGLITGRKTAS